MSRGFFVVLEGADGSGKTEQAKRLAATIRAVGRNTLETREPSTGPIGRLIRQALLGAVVDPSAMGALFAADRFDHAARQVLPALELGAVVVCDRYDWSNIVYRLAETQGPLFKCGAGRCDWTGDDLEWRFWSHTCCPRCGDGSAAFTATARERLAWVRGLSLGAPVADLTVVLAVPVQVAAERRRARGGVEIYETDQLQARCCALYARADELAGPGERVVVVDGVGDEDAVAERVWAAVAGLVRAKGAT